MSEWSASAKALKNEIESLEAERDKALTQLTIAKEMCASHAKERDTLRAQLTRLESANAVLREHLTWIRDTEGAAKWQLLAWAGNALAKAGQGEEK